MRLAFGALGSGRGMPWASYLQAVCVMEFAGWVVALVIIAYRIGWTTGAQRMAAAMCGRSTGVTAWVRRRVAAREERKDAVTDLARAYRDTQAPSTSLRDDREPGQYL
jgi:hypothetical protein